MASIKEHDNLKTHVIYTPLENRHGGLVLDSHLELFSIDT
jgi:hypothetical protein